jgi:isochorismate hydrolase
MNTKERYANLYIREVEKEMNKKDRANVIIGAIVFGITVTAVTVFLHKVPKII